jgi:hypothetical protein
MTPAQRIDYCRQFNQKAMPAWKDPRWLMLEPPLQGRRCKWQRPTR